MKTNEDLKVNGCIELNDFNIADVAIRLVNFFEDTESVFIMNDTTGRYRMYATIVTADNSIKISIYTIPSCLIKLCVIRTNDTVCITDNKLCITNIATHETTIIEKDQ